MKFPILFFLIFGFAISLNAQNNFTLNGNIGLGLYGFSKKQETDFTRYRYKEIFEYQAKESVSMGIELAYAYNSKWSFSAGVEYLFFKNNKKETYQYYDEVGTIYFESYRTNDQKIDALQMPLQGSYLILDKKNKLSIDFAFITSILIYSQFNFYEDEQHSFITNTFEKTTSFDKKIDCSVASGFTFKPNQKIAFRLSYEYDLATNFLNRSYFSEDVTISNDYELHTSGLEFEIIYQLTDKINPLTDKVNKLIGEINQFTDKVKTKN